MAAAVTSAIVLFPNDNPIEPGRVAVVRFPNDQHPFPAVVKVHAVRFDKVRANALGKCLRRPRLAEASRRARATVGEPPML